MMNATWLRWTSRYPCLPHHPSQLQVNQRSHPATETWSRGRPRLAFELIDQVGRPRELGEAAELQRGRKRVVSSFTVPHPSHSSTVKGRKADQGGVEPPKYARACAGASGDATPYPCRQHGRQTSTDQAAGPSPRGRDENMKRPRKHSRTTMAGDTASLLGLGEDLQPTPSMRLVDAVDSSCRETSGFAQRLPRSIPRAAGEGGARDARLARAICPGTAAT